MFLNCKSQKIEQSKDKVSEKPITFSMHQFQVIKNNFTKYIVYIEKLGVITASETFWLGKECWTNCEGKRLDFGPIQIEQEGNKVEIPVWLFNLETKRNLNNKICDGIHFIANKSQFDFDINFQTPDEKFKAFPHILVVDDSLILFVLDLLRLEPADDEYFPSSERLRIEITSQLGKPIWNSDFNMYFLQVVGKVEPLEVGKVYRYVIAWNRRDNNGQYVGSGTFNVAYILPIKPNNILKILNLELKKSN
ncbi:MAG: hypothetical protein N2560_07435 [Ignavibacteria bacterium]|nr:hypothetical protein [Ignavibacteria bacterium]